VLSGHVERGDMRRLDAVVLLTDLCAASPP